MALGMSDEHESVLQLTFEFKSTAGIPGKTLLQIIQQGGSPFF